MGLSEDLTKLAARAKETEVRAAAARSKAKAEVEREVASAREAAEAQREELRRRAAERAGMISDWWVDAQASWNERIDAARYDMERKKAAFDVTKARKRAERAEDDAAVAIDAAYWAVEEAEYAVLDAVLARMDADDVAAAKGEAPQPVSSQS